ncbi:hypothetical protein M514_13829 [Trichuris suis]|uniref:Uncharacterized protein n=1 Tax=Trichuris suis TaxID=68888 RepID=A0A085MQS4_9BILA|nr:hypothetical protein M514_13829 [Trichuris suis]
MFCHADNPQNYKSSEEAQVHQSGEQDQLVGRRVRTQLVRDLCAKNDGERKTRATVTTAEMVLPLGAQMRDCAIPVSTQNSKVAWPRRLGPGSAHWTNSSKNAKLLATAQGQGKGEPSVVDTERCLLQSPDMEKLNARAKRPLNRGRHKS